MTFLKPYRTLVVGVILGAVVWPMVKPRVQGMMQ